MLNPKNIDHIVLTVVNLEASEQFYCDTLGMKKKIFSNDRVAFHFGSQKINIHPKEKMIDPLVKHALPGSSDICLIFDNSIRAISTLLKERGIRIAAGPSKRTGAKGTINSVYCYDPDENLVELSTYDI